MTNYEKCLKRINAANHIGMYSENDITIGELSLCQKAEFKGYIVELKSGELEKLIEVAKTRRFNINNERRIKILSEL